jgi:hypothetical protein
MASDDALVYLRWTLATLDFGPTGSSSGVMYRFHFADAAGAAKRATVIVGPSTAAAGSLSGDPPQVAGMSITIDRNADTILISFPREAVGATPGSTLAPSAIATAINHNGAVTPGGLWWTNTDTVPSPPPFVLPGSAPAAPGGPSTDIVDYYEVAELDFVVVRSLTSASHSEVYNWTSSFSSAVLNYTNEAVGGYVSMTIMDGSLAPIYETILDNTTTEIPLDEVQSGNWTVRLDYETYTGNLSIAITEPSPLDEGPGSGPGSGPGDGPGGDAGNETGDGNATTDSTDAGKGSPGLALPALVLVLAAAAIVLRRRR